MSFSFCRRVVVAGCCLGLSGLTGAEFVQWDFAGNLLSASGGTALVAGFSAPATAAQVAFQTVAIGNGSATIASFGRGTHLRAIHGLGGNGGGSRLNQFTLVLDLNTPSRPSGWAALYQSNPANTDDGEWFINPTRGVGIGGNYGGTVADGSWVRLAVVVDCVAGTLTSFVNGQSVQQTTGLTVDGRWSLGPEFLLFADENQENAPGLVNAVQLRPWAMATAEIAALGGPAAVGIPRPVTPTLTLTRPNGGERIAVSTVEPVTWAATDPGGMLRVTLTSAAAAPVTLGEVPMAQRSFNWAIPPWQPPGDTFRIELASLAYPAVTDTSDANFTITGSGPLNPKFGQPLQQNGGFENQLVDWSVVLGRPVALVTGGTKGAAHGGNRFLHGGLNRPGDAMVRQEIDLLAAGFVPEDLAGPVVVEAEAWLRNRYGAGTFDDQVFCRIVFADADGGDLGSVRCLVAADSVWLRRPLVAQLPPGTRKLRLEIVGRHRRDADNDSMADDFTVRLQRPWPPVTTEPAITKLPMLQDVRPDAMTLLWETDHNFARHVVEWGRSNVAEQVFTRVETLQIDASHFVHRATLTGLERETAYAYRVRSGATVSPTFSFRSAPRRDTPFVTAWWGDNHNGTATLRQHVANLLRHSPDLICVAGDMVNSGNALGEWHDYWFKPLEHLNAAQTTPVVFARGNHDGEHALAYAYSALPGNESWFAFDYGNSRFIFLDSEADGSVSPEQRTWLAAELARPETQQAAFRVVCFHKPPWSQFWNGGGHTQEAFVVNEWVPLFRTLGVDLVICGHEHAYHRGLRDGVTYVVSGGGGGTIDTERVAHWPHVQVEFTRYHFDVMTVNGRRLGWETYDSANQLIDEFSLVSRVPEVGLEPDSKGDWQLSVAGRAGSRYRLEESSALGDWTAVGEVTIPADGSPVNRAWASSGAVRLVRAVALP
jgi:3',5'-cyclic AMP phosphodiesterase CpdA